jgi:hypothetical protein
VGCCVALLLRPRRKGAWRKEVRGRKDEAIIFEVPT